MGLSRSPSLGCYRFTSQGAIFHGIPRFEMSEASFIVRMYPMNFKINLGFEILRGASDQEFVAIPYCSPQCKTSTEMPETGSRDSSDGSNTGV